LRGANDFFKDNIEMKHIYLTQTVNEFLQLKPTCTLKVIDLKHQNCWPGFYIGKICGKHRWVKPVFNKKKLLYNTIRVFYQLNKKDECVFVNYLESINMYINNEIQYTPTVIVSKKPIRELFVEKYNMLLKFHIHPIVNIILSYSEPPVTKSPLLALHMKSFPLAIVT
jgi:hypothetical protein